jgi:hypothetical protein
MKDEDVVVNYGDRLSNVLVRLTKGVKGDFPAFGFDAVLDQAACMYRPRVLGMMAGQTLVVRNSDQTLHDVHTFKGATTVFNQAIVPGLERYGTRSQEITVAPGAAVAVTFQYRAAN